MGLHRHGRQRAVSGCPLKLRSGAVHCRLPLLSTNTNHAISLLSPPPLRCLLGAHTFCHPGWPCGTLSAPHHALHLSARQQDKSKSKAATQQARVAGEDGSGPSQSEGKRACNPPLCNNNGKSTENDGNNCSEKDVVYVHRRRHKEWRYLRARSMYDDLCAWTTRHVAKRGRTVISIPRAPSPPPNHVVFMHNQKVGSPNPTVPRVAEATPPAVLTTALFSQAGGGGSGMQPKRSEHPFLAQARSFLPHLPLPNSLSRAHF